ncbi:MAG: hypothetical protein PHP08_00890 [Candidatus Dojkabacteria bacterium]|nr:hypothetical protein [Candidatus Dojkabacteria bacterium]
MKIVAELILSKKSEGSVEKHKNGKKFHRNGKKKRSDSEQKLIESLINENNMLYKRAKERGYALQEEKLRCNIIREELIEMKAI